MSDQVVASARMIGEIFVERGLVTREQLEEALVLQARDGGLVGEILVSSFGVSRVELATALAEQWRAIDEAGRDAPTPPMPVAEEHDADGHSNPEPDQERRPIGEIFVASGAIGQDDLDRALATQRETGERLGEILVAQGAIGRLELASALAEQWSELQVIRPPQPKESQPWQEAAVRAAATASTADDPREPAVSTEVAGLVDAVRELEHRVAEVARRPLPDVGALEAEVGALATRLEGIEGRLSETVGHNALAELTEALERLQQDLGRARSDLAEHALSRGEFSTIASRFDELTATAVDRDDLARLESMLAELSGTAADRDDLARLETTLAELSGTAADREALARVEATLAGLAGTAVDREAFARLEEAVAELASTAVDRETVERVESTVSALTGADHAALARFEEALAELASTAVDREAFARLDAAVAELASTAVDRETVERVESALAGLSSTAVDREALERVEATLAGLAGTAVDRDAVTRLETAVAELAATALGPEALTSVEASIAELATSAIDRETFGRVEQALTELAERVAGAAPGGALGDLSARFDALEERLGEPQKLDSIWAALEALQRRLDAPAAASEELRVSLDDLRSRVGQLAESIDRAPDADRLAALESMVSDRSALDDISTRLDVLARGAARREDVDALHEALERDVEALRRELETSDTTDLDERFAGFQAALAGLRQRVDERESDEARARLEQEIADRIARENAALAAIEHRVDEVLGRVERVETDASSASSLARDLAAGLEGTVPTERVDQLEARVSEVGASLSARLDAVDGALGEISLDVLRDELRRPVRDLDERVAVLQVQLDAALADRQDGDRTAAELRAELEALATDLHRRLDETESTLAEADVETRFGTLEARVADVVSAHATLDRRLAEVSTRADGAVGRDEMQQEIASQVAASSEALTQRLSERFAALEHELVEVDGRGARAVDEAREALESRLAESVSRAEVGALAGELGARAGRVEAATEQLAERLERDLALTRASLEETTAHLVSRQEHEALAGKVSGHRADIDDALAARDERSSRALETLEARLQERLAGTVSHGELEEVWGRVVAAETGLVELGERVTGALLDVVRGDEVDERIAARLASSATELSAVLGEHMADVAGRFAALEDALTEVDGRALSVAEAVQQGVEQRLAGTASQADLTELRAELEAGIDGQIAVAHRETASRLEAVTAELQGTVAALHVRIDELAAGLGHTGGRLVAVEQSLPEPGLVEELRFRVEAVHRRVEEEISLGDQRTKATEKALRKGLAGLGERLVASEQAYVEAGSALHRSIQRLGAAVVEADARLAGEPLDPPATGFVAFVPTADGYRLTALDGPVPALDAVIEVDGFEALHRAVRITRSPLPLDRRACVYLERVD